MVQNQGKSNNPGGGTSSKPSAKEPDQSLFDFVKTAVSYLNDEFDPAGITVKVEGDTDFDPKLLLEKLERQKLRVDVQLNTSDASIRQSDRVQTQVNHFSEKYRDIKDRLTDRKRYVARLITEAEQAVEARVREELQLVHEGLQGQIDKLQLAKDESDRKALEFLTLILRNISLVNQEDVEKLAQLYGLQVGELFELMTIEIAETNADTIVIADKAKSQPGSFVEKVEAVKLHLNPPNEDE